MAVVIGEEGFRAVGFCFQQGGKPRAIDVEGAGKQFKHVDVRAAVAVFIVAEFGRVAGKQGYAVADLLQGPSHAFPRKP